jgi:hypothetical protein
VSATARAQIIQTSRDATNILRKAGPSFGENIVNHCGKESKVEENQSVWALVRMLPDVHRARHVFVLVVRSVGCRRLRLRAGTCERVTQGTRFEIFGISATANDDRIRKHNYNKKTTKPESITNPKRFEPKCVLKVHEVVLVLAFVKSTKVREEYQMFRLDKK